MNESSLFHPEFAAGRYVRPVLIAAGIGLAALIAGYFLAGPDQFFRSYLLAFVYWTGLSLGSLAVALLHYLVGGRWGRSIRRIIEAASKNLWLMGLLFLPLLLGLPALYEWARPEALASEAMQHKSAYLNVPFFIIRNLIYFGIWIFLSQYLTPWSERGLDKTDYWTRRTFQRLSATGIILYALTVTFAATDWLMSLQPGYVSTIYGMLIMLNQVLGGLAFALLILPWIYRGWNLVYLAPGGILRDLGAFLLTFVVLWTYLAFFQYLITWAGNIPREAVWYAIRTTGGWEFVVVFVVVFQFLLPFFALLTLRAKRNAYLLSLLGGSILVTTLVDLYWHIMPVFHPGALYGHWLDLVAPLAIGALWLAAFLWNFEHTPQPAPAREEVEIPLPPLGEETR